VTTRRKLLLALGALAALPALAQQEKRVRRIGYLSGQDVRNNAAYLAAFREGMAALGWADGRDYAIDARYANGDAQAMEGLATELVASQADLLLTVADGNVRVIAERTKTIPIVFALGQDPVANGVAASLRRPGGNATGLTSLARELGAKRLQLLKEAFPRVAHVVVLFEPDNAGSRSEGKEIEQAAARLKMRVTTIGLRRPADIEAAFKRGATLGAQGYMVAQGFFVGSRRQAIAERALRAKAPTVFFSSAYAEAGGLMSYGPSYTDSFRRAAAYVDKILKGAKPGDLPIEQPTRFELVLNLKTAKAMGIKFPQSILIRAERVIE